MSGAGSGVDACPLSLVRRPVSALCPQQQVRGDRGQVRDDDEAGVGREVLLRADLHDVDSIAPGRGRSRGGVLDDDTVLGAQVEAFDRRRVGQRVGLGPDAVVAGDQDRARSSPSAEATFSTILRGEAETIA